MIKPEWDANTKVYAANVLLKHLQSLQDEMEGVRLNRDIEHVHRMRVASRRLRNALGIFSSYFPGKNLNRWIKSIKKITSSLGEARDKDVQILFVQNILSNVEDRKQVPGLKRIILRLKQNRAAMQNDVINALDELTTIKAMDEIHLHFSSFITPDQVQLQGTPDLFHMAWETILPQLQEFLSYEIFMDDPAKARELHVMRICAKKLRYSMELFAPFYPEELKPFLQAARQTQDQLGTLHDAYVWDQYLSGFLGKEKKRIVRFYGSARGIISLQAGISFLSQQISINSQEQYQALLTSWQEWQTVNLWQELVNTLKFPLM